MESDRVMSGEVSDKVIPMSLEPNPADKRWRRVLVVKMAKYFAALPSPPRPTSWGSSLL